MKEKHVIFLFDPEGSGPSLGHLVFECEDFEFKSLRHYLVLYVSNYVKIEGSLEPTNIDDLLVLNIGKFGRADVGIISPFDPENGGVQDQIQEDMWAIRQALAGQKMSAMVPLWSHNSKKSGIGKKGAIGFPWRLYFIKNF